MIITLDLSTPRKLTQDIINDLVFSLKMSNKDIQNYKEHSQKALMCLILSSQITTNVNNGLPQSAANFERMCKYAELYSIPILYSIYEIFKAKESLIHSILEITRSSKKIFSGRKKETDL
jgi:hypothetical protein